MMINTALPNHTSYQKFEKFENPRWLKIEKSRYLYNRLADFYEISHADGLQRLIKIQMFNNLRWRMVAILKKDYTQYLHNRLIDFDKIWYGDAYSPSQP